jgi:hypothetical protein
VAPTPHDWTPHIGRKVTMRYVLDDDAGTHTELIGVLQNVTRDKEGTRLKVRDRHGATHEIAAADVVAARVL